MPSKRRIYKVIDRAVLIDMTFYLIIAFTGYFSNFEKTSKVVIERDPLNKNSMNILLFID